MDSIASPNWLVIAGLIYLAFAFGLALNGLIRSAHSAEMLQRTRADAGRRVDALMAAPYVAAGMCCLVGAQFATLALNPSTVVLILSAPMGLLLYLGFEGLWAEEFIGETPSQAPSATLLRLPSPVMMAQPLAPVPNTALHPSVSVA